jgi:hypothetical protein
MARITVTAHGPADGAEALTLSERIVAAHLDDRHYVTQLIERLAWATHDAELLEMGAGLGGADAPSADLQRPGTTFAPRRESEGLSVRGLATPVAVKTTNPS